MDDIFGVILRVMEKGHKYYLLGSLEALFRVEEVINVYTCAFKAWLFVCSIYCVIQWIVLNIFFGNVH